MSEQESPETLKMPQPIAETPGEVESVIQRVDEKQDEVLQRLDDLNDQILNLIEEFNGRLAAEAESASLAN